MKQKKLDLANRNEYLQSTCKLSKAGEKTNETYLERMAWNQFLEDVDGPLEEVPEEHYPLIALLVQES